MNQIGHLLAIKMGRPVEATQPSDPAEVISNLHARITPLKDGRSIADAYFAIS